MNQKRLENSNKKYTKYNLNKWLENNKQHFLLWEHQNMFQTVEIKRKCGM